MKRSPPLIRLCPCPLYWQMKSWGLFWSWNVSPIPFVCLNSRLGSHPCRKCLAEIRKAVDTEQQGQTGLIKHVHQERTDLFRNQPTQPFARKTSGLSSAAKSRTEADDGQQHGHRPPSIQQHPIPPVFVQQGLLKKENARITQAKVKQAEHDDHHHRRR